MNVPTILLAVVSLLVIIFLYNWLFGSHDYWTSRGIPCLPKPLPIFGNTLSVFLVRVNMPTFVRRLYNSHPENSMVGFYNILSPVLVVRHPDLVKSVVQTNFQNFRHNNASMDAEMDPLFGRDPLFSRDQIWRHSRSMFVSTMSLTRMKLLSPIVAEVCKEMANHLAEKSRADGYVEVNGKLLFSRYTTEVAARGIFGVDGHSFADDYSGTFLDCMKMVLDPTKSKGLLHHIIFFLPALRKIFRTRFIPVKVDKYFRKVVKDLAELRAKEGGARNDMFQMLLDMEKSAKIQRIDLLSHAISLFVDSFETSSVTLSTICYYMAKHPKYQERLREEIEAVLAKHEGEMSYEAINEMTYLDQVMSETLRITPASGLFSRQCAESFRLEGPDGLSVKVEVGTTVMVPVVALQNDPKFWGNPEVFDPERFAKGRDEGRHKFVYMPFGDGPRACPGQRLGALQVKAAIAVILRNYRIETSPKMLEPVRMDPAHFLSLPVGGYWYNFRSLKKNQKTN